MSTLTARLRSEIIDDAVAPYLWSDAELALFEREAMVEACKRAPLVTGVTTIAVVAGTSEYTLDPTVWQILQAKIDGQTNPLDQTTFDDLVMGVGAGWASWEGMPQKYVRRNNTITLYPKPTASGSLLIKSTLIPDEDYDPNESLGVEYLHGLLYYMAYRCFTKRDADTHNPQAADEYLNRFNAFFGLPKTAKYHMTSQAMPMNATVMGGRLC